MVDREKVFQNPEIIQGAIVEVLQSSLVSDRLRRSIVITPAGIVVKLDEDDWNYLRRLVKTQLNHFLDFLDAIYYRTDILLDPVELLPKVRFIRGEVWYE